MTSTSSWKSLPKPRHSTKIVKLPMNTAFQNPWWDNDATSNMSFFWWAADDSKVCIHVMLPTGRTWVGYYITEQVLLRTYANFCLFPFLQKSINVLKAVFSFWFIGIKDWIRRNLHYTSDQKALLFLLFLSTFSVFFFSF